MIVMTLKSRAPHSRFQLPAEGPRPRRPLGFGAPAAPADRDSDSTSPADSMYLRRWIAHQATTYNSLLETIAAAPAPAPHTKRD